MKRFVAVTFVLCLAGAAAAADRIGDACLKSERGRGQRSLCYCIQRVADQTLTARDQKRAAEFFINPERAQEVRRSDSRSNEVFWERYERFGVYAERICRG